MQEKPMDIAVLFLVFNRLDPTKEVFSTIRMAKPSRLYIASDGPRIDRPEEIEKVNHIRDYLLKHVDWECKIETLFREKNLGCKYAVGGAIKWFFKHEEMGIILEDDCLPNQSFFKFCSDLLIKHKDDDRIGMISGRNELGVYEKSKENDYFLTNRCFIWGWASWRRSCDIFDNEIANKNLFELFLKIFSTSSNINEFFHRLLIIKEERKAIVNTWDYPWSLSQIFNSKLTIVPSKNMIKNIGMGSDATHTVVNAEDEVPVYELDFPLRNNNLIIDKKFSVKTILIARRNVFRIIMNLILPKSIIEKIKILLKYNQ